MQIEELRELIKAHDQTKIAESSNITRSYINALATGKRVNPTLDTVNRILRAIKVLEK